MQPKRPTSVLVIAILQLVFGGLGLICGLFALAGQSMGGKGFNMNQGGPGADVQQQMDDFMAVRLPSYKTLVMGELVFSLLLSGVMVASGAGMLNMHSWGRTLGLGYAVVSILFKIVDLIYVLIFVVPAMSDFADAFAAKGGPGATAQVAQIMKISGIVAAVISFATIIYPVIVLIVLLQKSVAAAFRGEGAGQGEPGEFDDYGRGGSGDAGYGQQPPPGYGDDPGYRGTPEDRFGPPR